MPAVHDATPDQSGGKDARVIQNDDVTRVQKCGKFVEPAVAPAFPGAVNEEHARSITFGNWLLRDQSVRQLVMEFGNPHDGTSTGRDCFVVGFRARCSLIPGVDRRRWLPPDHAACDSENRFGSDRVRKSLRSPLSPR